MMGDPNKRALSKSGVPLVHRRPSIPASEQNYIHIAKGILEASHQYIIDIRDASDAIQPCIEGLEAAGFNISLIKDLDILKGHANHNAEHFMAALEMKPKFLDVLAKGGHVGQQAADVVIRDCLDHLDERQKKRRIISDLCKDIKLSISTRISDPDVDAREKELLAGFKEAISPGMSALIAAQDNFLKTFDSIEGTASLTLSSSKAK